MKILAIDTATQICGLALAEDDQLVADLRLNQKNIHNEKLITAIQELLAMTGWSLNNLEGVALTLGPGSFTGLRIGLSVAKGLSFALDIPIAGINTLDAMAASVVGWSGKLCTLIKARAREVYFATYNKDGNRLQRCSEYQVLDFDQVTQSLTEKTLIVAHPLNLLDKLSLGPHLVGAPGAFGQPFTVAQLGLKKLSVGDSEDLTSVEPFYLQDFFPKRKVYQYDS